MAMSFLGTQPLRTQVPPVPPLSSLEMKSRGSSHSATLAPAGMWSLHGLHAGPEQHDRILQAGTRSRMHTLTG